MKRFTDRDNSQYRFKLKQNDRKLYLFVKDLIAKIP